MINISLPKHFSKMGLCLFLSLLALTSSFAQKKTGSLHIIFSSDAHYGITRKAFMADSNVDAHKVNAVMIKKINAMPGMVLPADQGVDAGKKLGWVDDVMQLGDIANRMEIPYQSAAASWAQFRTDYLQGITLKNRQQKPAGFLIAPGNHDISNAVGFYRPMQPLTDPTSMVQIYNLMMKPAVKKTNDDYNYATGKVNYSRDIDGIHFVFITLWPDSAERIWMEKNLAPVSDQTPVIVCCHDQPTCEAKHFTNPVPPFDINAKSKFENLVAEKYKEGTSAKDENGETAMEQRGWVAFLKKHPNIKAYFHGNSNYNEFYVYDGPDHDVALNTFRVDSPMKGKYSSKDEKKLSFQLICIDPATLLMTVRECLWDTDPSDPSAKVQFGASKTVSLKVM